MDLATANNWQLNLFGRLEVREPGGSSVPVTSRKAGELLAYLAMRRNSTVGRDAIVDALWPDVDMQTGRNRLKAILSNLHRDLPGLPVLTHGKHFIELDRTRVTIDFEQCERRLKWRKSVLLPNRAGFAKQLLEVIGTELLPGFTSPWVQPDRDRYNALAAELRVEAERGGPETPARFRLDDLSSGVQVELVGRDQELGQCKIWLNDPAIREIHIVGMPGVGKTRLLRELMQLDAECDASIALSTVQATEVPWLERLGQTMGLANAEAVTSAIISLLSDFKSPRLYLDDVDQARSDMSAWISNLLDRVPQLRVLATARHRPTTPEVAVCLLQPLSEGDNGAHLLRIFAEHFGIQATKLESGAAALWEIAARLEGHPLSLEIAAAWLPILEPNSLRAKLDRSFDLITQQPGAGRSSLAECVRAILSDLGDKERRAMLCFSHCHGGCGQELAERMLGEDWVWSLRTLLDRSLAASLEGEVENRFLVVQALREAVQAVETPANVREARECWEAECRELAERLYFEVSEGDRRRWLDWLRDEGENILAACASIAETQTGLATALDLLDRLTSAFWLIGRAHEVHTLIGGILERAEVAFPDNTLETPLAVIERRVRRLHALGNAPAAVELATSHRRLVESSGDLFASALSIDNEGDIREELSDYQGAIECWTKAGDYFTQAGYPRHALWLESKIAKGERSLGRFPQAGERITKSLKRARELGDFNSEGIYLKVKAVEALEDHHFDLAAKLARDSVEAFRRAGERVTLAHALMVQTDTCLVGGLYSDAAIALSEAEELLPNPIPTERERLNTLGRLIAAKLDGRAVYKHLFAEH